MKSRSDWHKHTQSWQGWQYFGKTKPSLFASTALLVMRTGCWQQIWRGECRPFKTNAAGGCLVYHTHTKSIKQTYMYGNRSLSSPDRTSELLLSIVRSYHGSAMSVVMISYWRSYYKEQWMVVVTEEDCVSHGQRQGMDIDRPVDVVIAAHRRWQKSISSYDSGGICRSTPATHVRHVLVWLCYQCWTFKIQCGVYATIGNRFFSK